MLHTLKGDEYFKILTDEEVKDFVAINFIVNILNLQEKSKIIEKLRNCFLSF